MHIFGFNPSCSSLHKHPSWSYLFWNPVSSQLKFFLFWYDFSSDVNEAPTGLCSAPIIISMKTSIGAVIAMLQGHDPDNEIAIQNDPSNQSVIIRNKQQLTYSLSPQQNSWPFGIKTDSLFKSAVSMMYKWYPVITIYGIPPPLMWTHKFISLISSGWMGHLVRKGPHLFTWKKYSVLIG